jgi:hypothetical protein
MEIRIFHNNRPGATGDGYLDEDTLTEVYAFDEAGEFDFWEPGLEHVIHQWFSITTDRDSWHLHPCTIDYLFRGNRPLCAADVIAIDGTYHALKPGGQLEELESEPALLPVLQPGTVPFIRPSLDLQEGVGEALVNLSRWAEEALVCWPELDGWDAELVVKAVLAFLSAILPVNFEDDTQAALDQLREAGS